MYLSWTNFNGELARGEQEDRVRDVWDAARVPCVEHAVCDGERSLGQRVAHVAKPLAQTDRQESHWGESLICSLTIGDGSADKQYFSLFSRTKTIGNYWV